MCGIAGIYSSAKAVSRDTLKRGADALIHRGPDGEGFFVSDDAAAGLSHRRLSIIDLSTGAQPLYNETGDIVAVVNGEFYDFARIRAGLQAKGHVFKTQSDSEILIHLYEEKGIDCTEDLRGEFSFILWDNRRKILFAARDRFGIKPLCYAEKDSAIYLASEAKALFAMGVAPAWDHDSFHHAMSLQYTPQDKTLFKGVYQLKPGHALTVTGGKINTFKYWDIGFLPESETSRAGDAELIADFRTQLDDSIRLRLTADVPVCCHLSGGLDSASILGIASRLTGKSLDAFTVAFDHEGYDELSIAEEMAKHTGARLHAVRVTQNDLVDYMPDAVYYGEGLAINGHLAGKYLLNRAIRAGGFKVALSGEGSDEALAGYPHLRQDLLAADAVNDADAVMQKLYATNMASTGVQIAYGEELSTDAVQRTLGYVPAFLRAKAALGLRLHGILSKSHKAKYAQADSFATLMADVDAKGQLQGRHPVNQSSWLWSKLALANYILRTLGDGMEMAQSVEGRLPFLDHRLFESVRKLPLGMKIRGMTEKYVLREAAKDVLTDTIYKRQKHPFMAPPVSRYADTKLETMIRDTLASASFADVPFFDTAEVKKTVDKMSGMDTRDKTAMEPVLMTMLTAHILQQKFGLSA